MTSRYLSALLAFPFIGLTGFAAAQSDQPIYRTTEPDGTVVFSDRPVPNAVVIEPGPISVISTDTPTVTDSAVSESSLDGDDLTTPGPATTGTTAAEADTDTGLTPTADAEQSTSTALSENSAPVDTSARIDSVMIASPPADATLLDPTGPLLVEIGTEPGSLASSGLSAELLFDGDIVASGTMSQLAAPELLRGSHEIQVRLVNAKGRVVVESASQALHVRRTTVSSSGN